MKIAVIGSRKLPEFDLGPYLPAGTTQIISGGAKGVDSIAAAYAQNHGIPLVEYRPDYQRYGRAAPLVRNRQIVDSCDMVLAFGMAFPAARPILSAMQNKKGCHASCTGIGMGWNNPPVAARLHPVPDPA